MRQVSTDFHIIISHKRNTPHLFCRKNGGYSSLCTADCVFNQKELFEFVKFFQHDRSANETLSFLDFEEDISLIGLSPAQCFYKCTGANITEAVQSFAKQGEKQNAKKEKQTSKAYKPFGVSGDLDENWLPF